MARFVHRHQFLSSISIIPIIAIIWHVIYRMDLSETTIATHLSIWFGLQVAIFIVAYIIKHVGLFPSRLIRR